MNGRRFELVRLEDESGVSGTGVVAEGMYWDRSRIAILHWLVAGNTTTVYHPGMVEEWCKEDGYIDEDGLPYGKYSGIRKVERIHGHEGKTVVRWIDQ